MQKALTQPAPVEVFISYSSKDEELLKELTPYLTNLELQNVIKPWHGRMIKPGEDWKKKIDDHINGAKLVLLLVSTDFLVSGYCMNVEFKKARERVEKGEACIIPVLLRPCQWENSPVGGYQVLPANSLPVTLWEHRDAAYLNIARGIEEAAKTLTVPPKGDDYTTLIIKLRQSMKRFDEGEFIATLRDQFGVDVEKIKIVSVRSGSVIVTIKGDAEELARIVKALKEPSARRQEFQAATSVESVSYVKGVQSYSFSVGPPAPWLTRVLRQAIQTVPAAKYALWVAGIAEAVAIVAGFSVNYRVTVFGTILMLGLMFGLVSFASFVRYAKASIKPLALTLAWIFVLLISGAAFFISTGFFFSWPRPLQAYFQTSPAISVTVTPPYDPVGGTDSSATIAGKASVARPDDYRIVIYSLTLHTWYVQPTQAEPLTRIGADGKWEAEIHTGIRYAALLVERDYKPPGTTTTRPALLPGVVAAAEMEGKR